MSHPDEPGAPATLASLIAWGFAGLSAPAYLLPSLAARLVDPTGAAGMRFARRWLAACLRRFPVEVRCVDKVGDWSLGPYLLMMSQQSHAETFCIPATCPVDFRLIINWEYAAIPLYGWTLAVNGSVVIDRANRRQAIAALDRAASFARRHRVSLLISPEGRRSTDGALQPFKKGAFHLAEQLGFPVVPVIVRGARAVLPPGSFRFRRGTVEVIYETPIDPGTCPDLAAAVRTAMLAYLPAARAPQPTDANIPP